MPKAAKAAPKPAETSPLVLLEDWVLVRMPPEEGKPPDRYAVVRVEAVAELSSGEVIDRDLSLATGRKQVAIAMVRAHEAKRRSIAPVSP